MLSKVFILVLAYGGGETDVLDHGLTFDDCRMALSDPEFQDQAAVKSGVLFCEESGLS